MSDTPTCYLCDALVSARDEGDVCAHCAQELLPKLQATLADTKATLEHTNYWYSIRLARLKDWAHTELTEPLKDRFFSILANSTVDVLEPPTYAQQFNMMKHDVDRLEKELAKTRAELAEIQGCDSESTRKDE
jgi:hypothetical protein